MSIPGISTKHQLIAFLKGFFAVKGATGGSPGGSDTYTQYNDKGSFGGSPNFTYTGGTKTVEISGSLHMKGDTKISFDGTSEFIAGDDDGNTLTMAADGDLIFKAGGDRISWKDGGDNTVGEMALNESSTKWKFKDSSATEIIVIDGATNALTASTSLYVSDNLTVSGATAAAPALLVSGSYIGMGVSDPDAALEILAVRNQLKLSENDTDNTIFDHRNEVLTISVDGGGNAMFMDTKGLQVGKATFGVNSPKTAFEVHFSGAEGNLDPARAGNLSNNEGGGEVVYFGAVPGGTTLTAGKMYYLGSSGEWAETDASATGSGGNQLLAISLGTNSVNDGMLIRGFFDAHTYLTGTFTAGAPVYVCPHAGYFDAADAPQASGEFVRVVGYCTTLANVIYFNPDSTYVEVS